MPKIPLIGVSDTGRSKDVNSHRAINLMPVSSATGGKEGFYWEATPGLTNYATGASPIPSKAYGIYVINAATNAKSVGIFENAGIYNLYGFILGSGAATVVDLAIDGYAGEVPYFTNGKTYAAYVWGSRVAYCPVAAGALSGNSVAYFSSEVGLTQIVNTAGTTYTATTATNHGAATNDIIIIKGSTNFNNRYTITVTGATTFTFTHTNATDANETGLIDAYGYIQMAGNGTLAFKTITVMDSYFIANTSSEVYVSYPDDPRIWLTTNVLTADRDPDSIVRVINYNGLLWLLGATTTETYYNSGQGSQPFIPSRPTALDWGCASAQTVGLVDGGFIFLGIRKAGQSSVVLCDGSTIKPISTAAFDYQINGTSASSQASAYAFSYRQDSREFYQITFIDINSAYVTWCFDITTSSATGVPCWHERQDSTGARHRARFYAYDPVSGVHVVSDHTHAKLMTLSSDHSAEVVNGATTYVDRVGTSGHVSAEGKGLFHHSVYVDMEHPVGTGTINLSWSDDGGNTFNTGETVSFTGRDTRVEFFGLGYSRNSRVYRVTVADAQVVTNILAAYLNVTPGNF